MCCWGTTKKAYWHHNIFHLQSFITDVCGFGMIWLKLQRSTVVIDVHERNLLARCLSSSSREIPQSHQTSEKKKLSNHHTFWIPRSHYRSLISPTVLWLVLSLSIAITSLRRNPHVFGWITIKIHPYPSNFILIPHQNPHLWMVQNPLLPQLAGVRPSLAATSPWDFEKDPTRCFNGWFVEGNIIENVYIYIY